MNESMFESTLALSKSFLKCWEWAWPSNSFDQTLASGDKNNFHHDTSYHQTLSLLTVWKSMLQYGDVHFWVCQDFDKTRHKIGSVSGCTNCLKSIDFKNAQDLEIWSWNVGEISNSKRTVWVETPCNTGTVCMNHIYDFSSEKVLKCKGFW